jgi:hypothetical protein
MNSHTVDPLLSANLLGVNFFSPTGHDSRKLELWRGVDALQRPPGSPHEATGVVSDGVLGLSQPPGAARPNGGAPPLIMFKIFSISYLHSLAWNAKNLYRLAQITQFGTHRWHEGKDSWRWPQC